MRSNMQPNGIDIADIKCILPAISNNSRRGRSKLKLISSVKDLTNRLMGNIGNLRECQRQRETIHKISKVRPLEW